MVFAWISFDFFIFTCGARQMQESIEVKLSLALQDLARRSGEERRRPVSI